MQRTGSALLATLSALAWPDPAQAQQSYAESKRPIVAIENVAVVDVARGEILSPRTVLVAGGLITALEAPDAVTISAGTVRINGRGRYLIPGLVDMHVHLVNNATQRPPNEWAFRLFVANGITAVREMAARPADLSRVIAWQEAARRAELIAPRVLATGVSVNGDSIEAARTQVREAQAAGASFVKVFSDVPEPRWRAILDEARALKMPVCGHIPAAVHLIDAAGAGQRSNEHLTQVYEACSTREDRVLHAREGLGRTENAALRNAQEREVLETFDQRICNGAASALAKTNQAQVPTLVLAHFEARGSRASFREDTRWRYLRSDEQARWEEMLAADTSNDDKLAALRRDVSLRIVRTLHAAGVRILAGTDAPMPLVYPGFALHKELELLVEAGLTPADALRAATIWPAEFLGVSESSGSIAVGKRADLVLLDDNPLTNITHTQRIRAVLLDGRLLQRADLDALLKKAVDSRP